MRSRHERWAWWTSEHVDPDGYPLCAVLRPAAITEQDTDEMSDAQLLDAFIEAGWPFEPCPSWADDTEENYD